MAGSSCSGSIAGVAGGGLHLGLVLPSHRLPPAARQPHPDIRLPGRSLLVFQYSCIICRRKQVKFMHHQSSVLKIYIPIIKEYTKKERWKLTPYKLVCIHLSTELYNENEIWCILNFFSHNKHPISYYLNLYITNL